MRKIFLSGRIPSKKNSKWTKIINGKPVQLSSSRHKKWHRQALKDLKNETPILQSVKIQIVFWWPDRRRTDLTNKAESIMDLLTDAKIIEDDHYGIVPELILISGGLNKEDPGAEITFYDIPG